MGIIRIHGKNYTDVAEDTSDSVITYESGDELNPTESTEVPKLENVETNKSFAKKVSMVVKNVRYLLKMLGNTDISEYSEDGSVTGAIYNAARSLAAVGTLAVATSTRVQELGDSVSNLQTDKANKAGDAFTGPVGFKKGSYVSYSGGISAKDGYIIFARLTVKIIYSNHPIMMIVGSREMTLPTTICVLFSSVNSQDPDLYSFLKYGETNKKIYIKKSATSTWDLCMQKNEAYGDAEVLFVSAHKISEGTVDISYPDIQINTADFVVSEWREAEFGGKIAEAEVADNLNGFASTSTVDRTSEPINYIGYCQNEADLKPVYNQNDGAIYRQAYSNQWIHDIYGDYRTGQMAARGKNNGGWQPWRKIVDHLNFRTLIPEATASASGLLSTGDKTKLNNLKTVATSGSYNDLSNKPTIPSVGNGTVTIKQNGASKGSFTMNQSGATTIELTDNNTTYGVATQSADGLMSSTDKIYVNAYKNAGVSIDYTDITVQIYMENSTGATTKIMNIANAVDIIKHPKGSTTRRFFYGSFNLESFSMPAKYGTLGFQSLFLNSKIYLLSAMLNGSPVKFTNSGTANGKVTLDFNNVSISSSSQLSVIGFIR